MKTPLPDRWNHRLPSNAAPRPGETVLHYCPLEAADEAALALFSSWLDADERRRRDRYQFEAGKTLFVLAHGLTRYCLSLWSVGVGLGGRDGIEPGEWRFTIGEHGKPFVLRPARLAGAEASGNNAPQPPLPLFNISHTRGGAIVAVADCRRLGVDIESPLRLVNALPIAERFFTPEELADIQGQNSADAQRRRFIRYWTLKESYIKALGLGMHKPLSSFAFTPGGKEPALLFDRESEEGGWRFSHFPVPGGMVAGLAVQASDGGAPGRGRLNVADGGNGGWREAASDVFGGA